MASNQSNYHAEDTTKTKRENGAWGVGNKKWRERRDSNPRPLP